MTEKTRNKLAFVWWAIGWIGIGFIVAIMFTGCNRSLRKENERLREELAKAQQYVPLKRDTIRDTVEVVTQQVVEVEKIKAVLTKEDKDLLKDLSLKVGELESLQKIGMATRDTVWLEKKDSTANAPLYYKDAWAEFEYANQRLKYSLRDSLSVAVKRDYKHKFLFWKWGTKGYQVKVVNYNPHSTIRYNTFVKKR